MAQCGLMRASSTLATKVGAVGVPLTIIFFRDFHGQPQPPKKKKILGPAAQYYYRFCGDSNSKLIISSTMMVMMMKLGTEHFPIPAVELILCAF